MSGGSEDATQRRVRVNAVPQKLSHCPQGAALPDRRLEPDSVGYAGTSSFRFCRSHVRTSSVSSWP